MEAAGRGRARGWRVWVRRLLPWVVTVAVVAYLLHEYSLERIVAEMGRGDALSMVQLAAGVVLISIVIVSTADGLVIRGVLGPHMGYFDVLRGKAASSLLDLVGYALGHGGYAVWIARHSRTDAFTAGGLMLYIMASDLASVCIVASIAVWAGAGETPPVLRIVAPSIAGALLLFKAIGPLKLLGDRSPRVFHPWTTLPRRLAFLQVFMRAANIYVAALGVWWGARVFGLDLPLWAVAVYLPVILLVASLPVNVAGFGAVQAVWLLFTEWAGAERILAFQFLWQVAIGACIVLRGLPFVRRMAHEIERGGPIPERKGRGAAE